MLVGLTGEIEEQLKRIARQKQADIGGSFQDCYEEVLTDYRSGAISEGLINFLLKSPEAKIVLDYEP